MDIYQAHQLKVRGVTYFLINEKTAISGAQADEVFENALTAELSATKPLIESLGEGICLLHGDCKLPKLFRPVILWISISMDYLNSI